MRLVLLLLLLVIADASRALAADDAIARYQALVKAASANPQSADWQALRFAYADTPDFDPVGTVTREKRKKMLSAFSAHDYKTARAECDRILAGNFVDIAAHVVCDMASRHLGDEIRARSERDIVVGLLRSIHTGEGDAPATALTVISITEEYDYLNILGYTSQRQTLVTAGGHSYDMFDVERDGQTHTLYFLADRVLAAESSLLQPKP